MKKPGRKPGQGPFSGGRPKGSTKQDRKNHVVYFRVSDELHHALTLAAQREDPELTVPLYVRRFVARTHQEELQQVRDKIDPDPLQLITYVFRAECLEDVSLFRRLAKASIQELTIVFLDRLPDVTATFRSRLSLEALRAVIAQIPDGHVMLETVAQQKTYTKERSRA